MRLGKIVTLLLAGFLTFSSLNSFAATKNTKAKSSISTKKQATSKTTKAVQTSKKMIEKVIKKEVMVKKKSAEELHKHTARNHYQTGVASYYSDQFNGARTANGETFSNAKMTAAHRTLPFGTLIKVTNLRNGRSVVVRVNDRGPYIPSRILDLSSAAAKKIGMQNIGITQVNIAVLNKSGKLGSNEFYVMN